MKKVKILMVDDRPENLLALEAVIEDQDYELVKAKSGEQALKILITDDDYAVIIMDVQMPGLDGFETARLIKTHAKLKYIPLIFLTANNYKSEHITEGYAIGAIDYIAKPYEPVILKSKVECFVNLYKLTYQLTEQKELLQRAEALARVIGETSIDTMITMNSINSIITVNPAVWKMFGYKEDELLGQRIEKLFVSFDFTNYEMGKLFHVKGLRKNGETFSAEMQLGEAKIDNDRIFACTVRDITEREAQVELLKHQALFDQLTGLPNRTLLYERLEQAILKSQRDQQSFALFLLDIDNFKEINDTRGHHFGDLILKQVGSRIKRGIRKSDTVSRLGGDEFAVLLQPSEGYYPQQIADKITKILSEPFQCEGIILSVSASMGIAKYPAHGEDISLLMRRVDIAMYAAKRNGGGWKEYSTSLQL